MQEAISTRCHEMIVVKGNKKTIKKHAVHYTNARIFKIIVFIITKILFSDPLSLCNIPTIETTACL